jgi:hypothetical protein
MITDVKSSTGDFSYSIPAFPINSREGPEKGYTSLPGLGADNDKILKGHDR